jgi:replicative DNA helicase
MTMSERLENTILRNLLNDPVYYRKVIPHIKPDYFAEQVEKFIYEEIYDFSTKYDKIPTKEVVILQLNSRKDVFEDDLKNSVEMVKAFSDTEIDYSWLVDATEKWCQERAIYNALLKSVKIAEGSDKKLSKDAIPSILQEALGVSFDEHIGHDYLDCIDQRYNFYHQTEEKIAFDLDTFNYITKGGLPKKTLNIALAGTGVGKSLFMCHMAGSCLMDGYNVLYITLEMAEEKIAERIDAHLLDTNIKDLVSIPEHRFKSSVEELARKTRGRLIIKEYPTASAHAGHFQSLLNELSLKKEFKPDIIFVDYLNICNSARLKGSIVNSYTFVKSIAEELRGLAVKYEVPLVSATQTTRSGFGNTDLELTDTSESFGLPATADFMFALISTEELEQEGTIMVKQLKNRYNDPTDKRKFKVGIDRAKMKLYNVGDDSDLASDLDFLEEDASVGVFDNKNRISKFSEFY